MVPPVEQAIDAEVRGPAPRDILGATRGGLRGFRPDFPSSGRRYPPTGFAPRIVATMPFAPIPEIIEDLKAGRMIVLVDDEDRENEGDLVIPAEKTTPEMMNFILKYGRGTVCLAL